MDGSQWQWHWYAEFETPDSTRCLAVESVAGFNDIKAASDNFNLLCENGMLSANGIPVGSTTVDIHFIFRKPRSPDARPKLRFI